MFKYYDMKNSTNDLHNILLFSGIKPADLKPMLECLGSYTRTYKKGEFISLSEESLKCVGLLLVGIVHMLKEDLWGNKSILALIKEGEIFGETFACGSKLATTVSFFAASDLRVLFLPFDRVIRSCSMACVFHHRLIENMLILIADKNVRLMEKIEITSKKTLREKIFTYLSLQAQHHNSKHFVISMGRLELADYLCADRSALTRELSNMKADGLIDYDKNAFQLL